MRNSTIRTSITVFIAITLLIMGFKFVEVKNVLAQQPTGSIPTVTGTPAGPVAKLRVGLTDDRVKVRSGPNTTYPQIGVILLGAEVPVVGKSAGGDWLVVEYPGVDGGIGWVWALYMDVSPGEIPVIENPPTPAPLTTVTIDPTLAAQFITTPLATKMPTFTQPAPLVIPTFEDSTPQKVIGIPVGLVIITLVASGTVIGLYSYFRIR